MREIEFDILKGIMIICVVVGHSNFRPLIPIDVFWFHMPAFFLVAGYFMKTPQKNPLKDKGELIKKLHRYVIPYFAYSLVFFLIFHPEGALKNLIRTLYGGFNNITIYSYPYWFINTLFTSSICFSYMLWIFKDKKLGEIIFAALILSLYIIIHLDIYPLPFPLPWGLDESLGALIFMYTGFKFRTLKNKEYCINTLSILALIFGAFLIKENYQCYFNMEKMIYPNWVLDWIIPCSFIAFFYEICKWLKRNHYIKIGLSELGNASITIFFVHAAIFVALNDFSTPVKIVSAIAGGYIVHHLIRRNKYTQLLFIGKVDAQ